MHLTEIAYYTRKAIIFGAIALVVFLIIRQLLIITIRSYQESHRPPPPGPTVIFGKLPPISLPQRGKEYQLKFQLVTKEYGLPATPDRYDVFFIPKRSPNFLANDRAKGFAAQLGFTAKVLEQTPTDLHFVDPTLPARTLDINSLTNNFHLIYDISLDPSVLKPNVSGGASEAIRVAQGFLQKYGLLLPSFDLGKITTQLVVYDGKGFVASTEPSTAQATRVNFFEADINKTPWMTAVYGQSPSFVIVGNETSEAKKILEAQILHFPIDVTNTATYPLKTSAQAWQEMTNGQGYVAQLPLHPNQDVLVRKVYLAYFFAEHYESYIQPIFVFEGDEGFIGYVTGITEDWIDHTAVEVVTPSPKRNFVLPTTTAFPSPQTDRQNAATPSGFLPSP